MPKDRLLDAALEVFEARGVREGTMREIARKAGVGRATLYRRFPRKDDLVASLVLREARRLFAFLDRELSTDEDLERGLLSALAYLREHRLLQRVLREEPESILPWLTVRAAPLLEGAVEFAAPYIERAAKEGRIEVASPRSAAELAARVLLSLVLTPSVTVDLDDPEELGAFVSWLMPKGGKR